MLSLPMPDTISPEALTVNPKRATARASKSANKEAPKEFEKLLVKTKLCTFWPQGLCRKGSRCPFAHGEEELQKTPDFSKRKMCKFFMQKGACKEASCRFAHSATELKESEASPIAVAKVSMDSSEDDVATVSTRSSEVGRSPLNVRARPWKGSSFQQAACFSPMYTDMPGMMMTDYDYCDTNTWFPMGGSGWGFSGCQLPEEATSMADAWLETSAGSHSEGETAEAATPAGADAWDSEHVTPPPGLKVHPGDGGKPKTDASALEPAYIQVPSTATASVDAPPGLPARWSP